MCLGCHVCLMLCYCYGIQYALQFWYERMKGGVVCAMEFLNCLEWLMDTIGVTINMIDLCWNFLLHFLNWMRFMSEWAYMLLHVSLFGDMKSNWFICFMFCSGQMIMVYGVCLDWLLMEYINVIVTCTRLRIWWIKVRSNDWIGNC